MVAKVRSVLRTAESNKQKAESAKPSALNLQPAARLKVGHAGTLDPFATGLLIILVGDYTKRADEFLKLDKTYEVVATLGETSSTGDPEGVKLEGRSLKIEDSQIEKTLKNFVGEIEQTPPAYSAIKVNGQRAYKLARAGKTIDLKPRPVTIHSYILRNIRMPEVEFEVKVSSGTYIRSLVEDIGGKLGTGAYTSALRRTKIDKFDVRDALQVKNLTIEKLGSTLRLT